MEFSPKIIVKLHNKTKGEIGLKDIVKNSNLKSVEIYGNVLR